MRQIWFPNVDNRYTTEDEIQGGFMIVSQGKDNVPIYVTFGWTQDGTCRCGITEVLEGTTEYSDVGAPFRLCHVAYDSEAVDEADNEQQAVDLANEYQGGEYDAVYDLIQMIYPKDGEGFNNVYQGDIDVAVGNFEDAWYTIEHLIVNWANTVE